MIHQVLLLKPTINALKWRSILYRLLSMMLLLTITCSSYAGFLYRYKNENDLTVLSQTLPAYYSDKGYDILNEKGRLVRSVPPALTPEEIRIRDEAIEQERLALIEIQKQEAADDELKLLYSLPNDAVRVLSRNVLDIQSVIEIKRSKINNLKSQIIDEESRAAERQRKGYAVSEDAFEKLNSLKKDIVNTETDIKALFKKLANVAIEFDQKIKRLEIITNKQATDYPDVLEAIEQLKQQSL